MFSCWFWSIKILGTTLIKLSDLPIGERFVVVRRDGNISTHYIKCRKVFTLEGTIIESVYESQMTEKVYLLDPDLLPCDIIKVLDE